MTTTDPIATAQQAINEARRDVAIAHELDQLAQLFRQEAWEQQERAKIEQRRREAVLDDLLTFG